jgi:NADH dehydrogenase FAD-containing subunit/uncharacterized membrane protein YphA (DoxX/SURF4 family)
MKRWMFMFVVLVTAFPVFAHEGWILSPAEVLEWSAKPKPAIFTQWGIANICVLSIAFLFAVGWVRLGQTGARELFADLQVRLSSYGDYASVILRFCAAWALISSTFALEPRLGNAVMESPTLFAPDLELRLLSPEWMWLKYVQLGLGLMLLFGIYTRLTALLLAGLVGLGWYLFGQMMLTYLTALLGGGLYLILQGGGSHYIPMPTPQWGRRLADKLASIPRTRAQFILRIMAGLNFLYLGVYFKVLQPNLALGIINIYEVPILSWNPELFVLIMAVVETMTGIFLLLGVLMRPMSLFLLGAFIFFASVLPESMTAHMLFYGVMLTFLFNAAGHWQKPVAKDKAAHIVIIGSGFGAIAAALKLEKLIGRYSNVSVTLIAKDLHFVFSPLLPEVVGGSLQPGAMLNPLRRIFSSVNLISAEVERIQSGEHQLLTLRVDGEQQELAYDKLIIARESEPDYSRYPGLAQHSLPLMTVGDALHIRKHIIKQFEKAMLVNYDEKKRLLTFAVLGNGEKGAATAIELRRQLNAAATAYPGIDAESIGVFLLEPGGIDSSSRTFVARNKVLDRYRIQYMQDMLESIAHESIRLKSAIVACSTVVNCLERQPFIYMDERLIDRSIDTDEYLRAQGRKDIYVCGSLNPLLMNATLDLRQQKRIGIAAAYNAWASTQCFEQKSFEQKVRKRHIYHMARRSMIEVGPFCISGPLGWWISRYQCLQILPGLERNLRMMIDWLLDIPFRNDIAVLASEQSNTLEQVSFHAGEAMIVEEEEGDCAYIIQRGEVCVSVDGKEVAKLGKNACVGEMALIENAPRSATVTCITDVLATKVTQGQFEQLFSGFDLINEALRDLSRNRRKDIENAKIREQHVA